MPSLTIAPGPRSDPEETVRKARRLVDERTGIIRSLYEVPCEPDAPRIFGYGSILADSEQYGVPHSGSVNGSTSIVRAQAMAGAIGEAIERYSAGFVPEDDLVWAAYDELRGAALDPRRLVLYTDAQYRRSGFPYTRFSDDLRLRWAPAYSLTERADLLVPACSVYIPYRRVAGEPPLLQLITTGLACGSTLGEAILSGICEVVERDAAMMMWLRGEPRRKLDCQSGASALLQETLRRFARSRYAITLIDVTTDLAIPAVVAVAIDQTGRGPASVLASNASLDPQQAAIGALDELAQCISWVESLVKVGRHETIPPLDALCSIEDHVLWPARRDYLHLASFVVSSPDSTPIGDLPGLAQADVGSDLQTCVDSLARVGLEIIAVDITPPDIREVGLHVVRVIIPGLQSLYFGSGLERISPRVVGPGPGDLAAPGELLDGTAALNHLPHPYP